MAINKNHEFEELNGVKCAIVEKNVSAERVAFLEPLLQHNGYKVVVVPGAPPKASPATPAVTEDMQPESPLPASSFTIGVTDVTFNPVNAVFGRLLKTQDGRVVTLAYWQQTEQVAQDDLPYFEKRRN